MFKRIFLFLAMNLAIIVVISISAFLIEKFFGVNIFSYTSYTGLFIFSLLFGFAGSFISLFLSKWMAKKAYSLDIVPYSKYDSLSAKQKIVFDTISDLSERNNIVLPEIGFYESNDPNAFATGASKNKSLIAVSSGLLDLMNKDEIQGVIAHEMAHIINGDMITMTLLQGVLNTFVIFISRIIANIINNYTNGKLGAFGYIAVVIVLEIVFGILASLIAMAFSRHREYRADEGSANFVGKQKMIQALEVLKKYKNLATGDDSKFAAMKISSKGKTGILSLLSSHPDLDKRIKALEELRI